MKAVVCESCLRIMSPLIEFRVIDKGRKSKKNHICPLCLERELRRMNHTKRNPNRTIDIPLDMDRPKITQEVKSMLD